MMAPAAARANDRGLRLPSSVDAVLDVFFDGSRVWSVDAGAHPPEVGGSRRIRWPEALRPYLDGYGRVTVREHLSGTVLLDDEYRFGSGQKPLRVVDRAGLPLAVNKWGHLWRPFEAAGERVIEHLLDEIEAILSVLREDCGLPAFLASGTLLGAVRSGELIGHDDDADVAYLSAQTNPSDVALEGFRVGRALGRCGWTVARLSAGHVQIEIRDADGAPRGVDVFTCFVLDEWLYQAYAVRTRLPRSAIVPLSEVELHGRRFPAPANPAALLSSTYGPGWRQPDPSFHFEIPMETGLRFYGWLGDLNMQREYWHAFYAGESFAAVPTEPSTFAGWVREREPRPGRLVDVGCGAGRDALWFAGRGYDVLGLDYALSGIARASGAAHTGQLPARFDALNLYDLRQVLAVGARMAHRPERITLYARSLLEALEDEGRHHLWRLASMALRTGGHLYLEFRTKKGSAPAGMYGEFPQRLLDPELVVREIESRGGSIIERQEFYARAVVPRRDPHVCRLVVRWGR